MSELADRVVLLTGASGGIGAALGRRLIAAGARVAFCYSGHPETAQRLASEAKDAGLPAVDLGGDLADPQTPARLVTQTAAALGPVDVLIANAGYAKQQAYPEVDLSDWDRTLAVIGRASCRERV